MPQTKPPARYLIGIDLGTTHTVVAYTDTEQNNSEIRLFEIEQLVAPGEVAARSMLPSLRYHPTEGELASGDTQLPWTPPDLGSAVPDGVVGELARELGSRVPGRLVASAKSWLSHASVDRTAPILPWGAAEGVDKISPLHASASYLAHVRAAWNHRFSGYPLENQDVVLTVPASFDEGARTLTVEAARQAGIRDARLLEEPQAACYDWLARHKDQLDSGLSGCRLLLVCDVGGGTTDLTLIKIELRESGPQLTRIGVGNHLMLGGDNMDLALAHVAEGRIVSGGMRLTAASLSQLTQQCRNAKERLLAADAPESTSVTVLGAGAKLIGGARTTELSRDEVGQMVLEGFFPKVAQDERPQRVRGGIVEFGLPYVADPAVTRHVAAFLNNHAQASREAFGDHTPQDNVQDEALPVPDAILLNGGVFRSAALTQRLLDTLGQWRGSPLVQLKNDTPDLAVARGAVAYAMARQGKGMKIGGGSARSYFIQFEGEAETPQGVCLLPRGAEEGQEIKLSERTFSLLVGQPVQFHLVSSITDTSYTPGDLVSIDDESFVTLPPIATVVGKEKGGGEVPVQLTAELTEVGTLAMGCVAKDKPNQRWKLEFQLRGAGAGVVTTTGELHPRFGEAAERIERVFGARSKDVDKKAVKTLRNELEKILGKRDEWDTPLLRELFGGLWDGMKRRRRSPAHERLWFNLTGFCLRPGFGYPLDDWRIQQLWSLYEQGVQYVPEAQVWAEWWTLWRRIAGGLDEQAQGQLFNDIAYDLQPPSSKTMKRPGGAKKQGYDDMVRLLAGLERLSVENKIEAGVWLLERLRKAAESPQTWWAVGRIGARIPFYGSIHHVIPPDVAAEWLQRLLKQDWKKVQPAPFAATLLARMSGDRERDIAVDLREEVLTKLRTAKAPTTWIQMVEKVTELDEADERRVFGESLPPGLKLVH
jgi:molecular chaperone DnaK (HSP70)